jgi:tetratricopeptide (TPR) repeat protein
MDGQRDLHALADVLGRSEFEVARTVYGLTAAGIVSLADPGTPGQEPEPGRDLAALLVPARDAMAQAQYDIAAGALEELLRRDPLMPEARRLLGVCQAALGRFGEALETWRSWSRLGPRSPGEESEAPAVERMRHAVERLMKELERFRD